MDNFNPFVASLLSKGGGLLPLLVLVLLEQQPRYGNELMESVMNIWAQLDFVRINLEDSRFGGLGHREQEIIYPFLIELNGLSEKIICLTSELQIEKP